jgi:hypothetical protein
MSYIYHSLAAFMDRDNVGLLGFAAYFKAASDEERQHANLLMAQQNRRGGRVKLKVRCQLDPMCCCDPMCCDPMCCCGTVPLPRPVQTLNGPHVHVTLCNGITCCSCCSFQQVEAKAGITCCLRSCCFLTAITNAAATAVAAACCPSPPLQTIHTPESEYASEARGEALWSLELALGLEKLNFGKLR